jgi:putative ABC transport system permease protein
MRRFLFAWRQDLRYSLRGFATRPGFAATIVLTIALGVGANAAIFSVVDAALLRPLPFAEPQRLVSLWDQLDRGIRSRAELSYPDFLDLRARTRALTGIAGYQDSRLTLASNDRALVLAAAKVTANFFDVLGVTPIAGRRFTSGEDAVNAPRVVILSNGLWQRTFGGDRGVIGRIVSLDGQAATVVGVLPAGFHFAGVGSAEIWVPIDRPERTRAQRGNHWLKPIARLGPGVSLDRARSEMARLSAQIRDENPRTNGGRATQLVPLQDDLVGPVKRLLLLLYGAVAFVLLVACGNVANLLLMRGAGRQRELSIRAALGAGRARIVRQLLTESGVMALAGGALGLLFARVGIQALLAAIPNEQRRELPYLADVGLDAHVLGYTLLVSVAAGLIFGLLPAIRAARPQIQMMLRQGAGGTSSRAHRGLRDGLVIAELALTVVLVSGAALFARSLVKLLAIDPGFRTDRVLTMMVPLPRLKYTTMDAQQRFYAALVDRVHALPGVERVGLTSKLPLDFGNSIGYVAGAEPATPSTRWIEASFREVTPDYFATMGITMVRGRTFDPRQDAFKPIDDTSRAGVVVINEALARTSFPGRDPIGERLQNGILTPATIIGVVRDVTIGSLEETVPPTIYFSTHQFIDPGMRLAVKVRGDEAGVATAVRAVIRELDPTVAAYQVYSMNDVVAQSQSVFMRRYPLVLVGSFALIALVLALIGTYGVVSYSVAERVRELGIRIALGAQPAAIRWSVLRRAGGVAAAGVGIGTVAAVVLSRFAASLLFGVDHAPWLFAGVALLLATVAVAAAVAPAQRATRVDPLLALRSE